jgi:hypothetical protein
MNLEKKKILDITFSPNIGMPGGISVPEAEGVELMQMPPVSVCHHQRRISLCPQLC